MNLACWNEMISRDAYVQYVTRKIIKSVTQMIRVSVLSVNHLNVTTPFCL